MTEPVDRGMMQDRLIDLVQGTGSAASRAEVEQAVAADADLAAELTTLRAVHAVLTGPVAPLDIDRIAAAIPPASAPRARRAVPPRWQWAAAVAAIALGGISLAVVNASYTGLRDGDLGRSAAESTLVVSATDRDGGSPLAVTFGQGLSEFDDVALDLLFDELAQFDGLVALDPIPVGSVPVMQGGD